MGASGEMRAGEQMMKRGNTKACGKEQTDERRGRRMNDCGNGGREMP